MLFRSEDVSDDGFEGEVVFATAAFELAPSVTVSGWSEAEVAAEIEEVVLDFDGFVVGAGRGEGSAEHVFIVNEEDGGAAGAEEDAVFTGGEVYFCECANQEGIVAGGAHAGLYVFVRDAEEAEGWCMIRFGGWERVFGPEV